MSMCRVAFQNWSVAVNVAGALAAAAWLAAAPAAWSAGPANPMKEAGAKDRDTCVECHADARFLVQNKKLYDYFQAWSVSLHKQENVTCVDCHGGDRSARSKEAAHGGAAMRSSQASSPINYRNIPETCAKCHKRIYEKFRESEHFQHLVVAEQEQQGPTCVTCHGSLNITVLSVATVRTTCAQCHNEKTDNSPEIPGQAETVLNSFLSINRYYRFIVTRSSQQDSIAFSKVVDPIIKGLNAEWHTFDIDKIEEKTHNLVQFMKVRRNDVLHARGAERK